MYISLHFIFSGDNFSRPRPDQWASRVTEAVDSRLYNFSMFSDILREETLWAEIHACVKPWENHLTADVTTHWLQWREITQTRPLSQMPGRSTRLSILFIFWPDSVRDRDISPAPVCIVFCTLSARNITLVLWLWTLKHSLS